MMCVRSSHSGFNLIEVSIVLAITSFIVLVLHNSFMSLSETGLNTKTRLELFVQQQKLSSWLQSGLKQLGQYDAFNTLNIRPLNWQHEQTIILTTPIVLPLFYPKKPTLGSRDGKSDSLVFNLQSERGCNGERFSGLAYELRHVVNELYVENSELRCRSYNGRYLTGLESNVSRWRSVSILRDVQSLQVKYNVIQDGLSRWFDADELQSSSAIYGLRLELLLYQSDAKFQRFNNPLNVAFSNTSKPKVNQLYQHLLFTIKVNKKQI